MTAQGYMNFERWAADSGITIPPEREDDGIFISPEYHSLRDRWRKERREYSKHWTFGLTDSSEIIQKVMRILMNRGFNPVLRDTNSGCIVTRSIRGEDYTYYPTTGTIQFHKQYRGIDDYIMLLEDGA